MPGFGAVGVALVTPSAACPALTAAADAAFAAAVAPPSTGWTGWVSNENFGPGVTRGGAPVPGAPPVGPFWFGVSGEVEAVPGARGAA